MYLSNFLQIIVQQKKWQKTPVITSKIDSMWKHTELPSLYKFLLKLRVWTRQSGLLFGNPYIYSRELLKFLIYCWEKK